MKIKKIIFLFVLILPIQFSCNKNPVIPEMSNSYFPIQLGNSWTFEFTYHGTQEVKYSITKNKIIDGIEYFAFDNWPDFIQYPLVYYFDMDSIFIRNDENGNVIMIANNKEFMFIKFDPSLAGTVMHILELYNEITQTKSIWQCAIYEADKVLETKYWKLNNGFRMRFFVHNAPGSQRDLIFFPRFGIVKMSYIAFGMDWKLKEAIINGKKLEKIVSYPNF